MSNAFENMTVVELRAYAREHHIPLAAGINKQGIIEKILSSENQVSMIDAAEPARAAEETPASAQARPRTAFIVTDDGEEDEDILSYRQPARPAQPVTYTQKPAADRPKPSSRQDVLSTISSKAPAFNIEGVRAWHNPRSFQQNTNYGNYPQGGKPSYKPQQPAAAPHTEQLPGRAGAPAHQGPQAGDAPRSPFNQEEAHYSGAADSRFLKDYHAAQKMTLPELLAEGEFEEREGVLALQEEGDGLLYPAAGGAVRERVYISHTQVRRFSLREGDLIIGRTKATRDRTDVQLMVYIEKINGIPVAERGAVPEYFDMPAEAPGKAVPLPADDPLFAGTQTVSLCYGQRVLIRLPEGFDPDSLIKKLISLIGQADPEAACLLLRVHGKPESGFADAACTVISADMAEYRKDQVRKISHAMERVKRMAENGRRVFFLIDSLDALTGLLDVPGSELSPFSCSALGRALSGAGSVTTLTFAGALSPASFRAAAAFASACWELEETAEGKWTLRSEAQG